MARGTVVILLAVALAASAASAFQGRLITPAGAPLAGAHVSVVGRRGAVITDERGMFALTPDSTPPFELAIATASGVALRPVLVGRLPESGVLEIRLEATIMESVSVVTGAVPDLDLPPGAAATVIGRTDLEMRGPAQLADVLENVPGVGRSEEGHSVVPGLRGLPKYRTLIVLDEGRVSAERRAGPSATYLDPATLDEIEVVRGPGSVAYGSDAFGGVIRARSRSPEPGAPTEIRYALAGSTGTGEAGARIEATTSTLGGGLLVGVHARRFTDYASPDGTVYNSAADNRGLQLGYAARALGGVVRLGWRSDLGRDVGKPATDSRKTRAYYPEENSHRFGVSYERPGPGVWSRLAVSGSWDAYQLVLNRDRFATAASPHQIAQADVTAHDYGARVEAERPLPGGRLLLGLDLNGRFGLRALNRTFAFDVQGSQTGTLREVSIDGARRDDLGAFLAVDHAIGAVRLAAGLRGDRVTSANSGGYFGASTRTNEAVSGFVGVTVPVWKTLEVTLQGARGFRDALLSDRYYRGVTGRGFITGNPDLRPEHSTQFDVAARWNTTPVTVAAYGYLYRISDLIERYRSGESYFFRNRAEAEVRGIELEATARLGSDVQLQVSAHTARGEVLDDHTPTDDIPARGLSVTLRRDPAQRWWWLTRVAAYARDDRPGPSEVAVPGYAVVDAAIGYKVNRALELALVGRNLANRAYAATADPLAVAAPGRSAQLTVRGRI